MQSNDFAASQQRLLPHTNITTASCLQAENNVHGRTHGHLLRLNSGSPIACGSMSPKGKLAAHDQEASTPKQLFETTRSSEQQKISNSRTQPSLEAAGKLAQDPGQGERATLGSTGPTMSTSNQVGRNNHSQATFPSNANSSVRLATDQTGSMEQSLSARRVLKAQPGTQSQQLLNLMQPFYTNAVHEVASGFYKEQGQNAQKKARSPRAGKQAASGKKPSHMANTFSSARRAVHVQTQDAQASSSETPNLAPSTRDGAQPGQETVVEAMLKRAYKRRQQKKERSASDPTQADNAATDVSLQELRLSAQESGCSAADDQLRARTEVDAEEDVAAEGGDFAEHGRGSGETAEGVEDAGPPLDQAREMLPLQAQLAHQVLAQQQRLFVRHIENSGFGAQMRASESPSAVVLTTEGTPGGLSSRRGRAERSLMRQESLAASSDHSHGLSARVFYRREEHPQALRVEAQYGSEMDESEEEGYCETSDYCDAQASEFPIQTRKGVHQAVERLDLEACSEEEEDSAEAYLACLHEDDLEIADPLLLETVDLYMQRLPGQDEDEYSFQQQQAIDESTPRQAYYEEQLPVSDSQGLESSRSCAQAPIAPFPSTFSVTTAADRRPSQPGCRTPLEQLNGQPSHMQPCISKTVESTNKKRAPTKPKPKPFKIQQIGLDLDHKALSPRHGANRKVILQQEADLCKGTPRRQPISNQQVQQQQAQLIRNKAVSTHHKTTRAPFGSTLNQNKNQSYASYLNDQTSVLAQRREPHDRSIIQGADKIRQKSSSATGKPVKQSERLSRNPTGQGKRPQNLSIFMTQKPAHRGPTCIQKLEPNSGLETPTLLSSSPMLAKKERQKAAGPASATSSKNGQPRKRDKRKQSGSQLSNPVQHQTQINKSPTRAPPASQQKIALNAKQKLANKVLMYEMQSAQSVRNHPSAATASSSVQQERVGAKRKSAIDPVLTQPGGVLGRQYNQANQTFSQLQLEMPGPTAAAGPKRSASKGKLASSKAQKVKRTSLSGNQQMLLTGQAQKVSAVACADFKSDSHQLKTADKVNFEQVKKETETTRKQQRQAPYSTSVRASQNISLQEMRINSQAVQISRFAKQGSISGTTETTLGMTSSVAQLYGVPKNTLSQQLKLDKKQGHATTVLGSHKNSIASAIEPYQSKGVNPSAANGVGLGRAARPSALMGQGGAIKPVKSSQGAKHPTVGRREAAGGRGDQRSASVLKQSANSQLTKTDKIESSLLLTIKERKQGGPGAAQQRLQTQRSDLSEVGTVNLGINHMKPERKGKQDWGLLDAEKALYGDRCPKGFDKLQLLGKGGCAVVWLAKNQRTGESVALKQFPKPKSANAKDAQSKSVLDSTAKIEIEVGQRLSVENLQYNGYAIDPIQFPGIRRIAKLYDVLDETRDVWLVYEVGAKPLSDHLFDVKGESYKGERIYGVQHQGFYKALRHDKRVLRDLIRMVAEVFDVLAMFRIVHADIKPDNILIDFDGQKVKDIKLIDFGSAFSYECPSNISASTPEYLAPEVLEYLENRAQNTQANGTNSTNLCRIQEPWSYDMWSLGAILLELLTGIPIWMSLKCRAQTHTGKSLVSMGIFGVQGRQGKKILQKQQASLKSLSSTLKKYDCYGLDKDPAFMDLLMKMLDPNPVCRISPIEVLEHPFITADSAK